MSRLTGLLWQAILPAALIAGYQFWAVRAHNPYFPPLGAIAREFRATWLGPGFTEHVLPSLWNLVRGYLIGLLAGVAGGVLLGRVRVLRDLLGPLVGFFLTLPAVALLPIFVIALGIGATMQVGVIVFSVFFVVLVNTTAGMRAVDAALIDVGRAYRIGPLRRLFLLLLPAAAPYIVAAARTALSIAVLVMVVSEMVGAPYGIGAVTLLAQQEFQYARMWAGMVLLALLGYSLNAAFALVERFTVGRWGMVATTGEGRS
ncbi:ABC transporter permease [Actinoplanes aureus]|uniref:ABC transporter permease subunit n=1 Tax=Actinoplanes aureus TaxID=2792083 RepID=A0A931CK43_9ACTN|nr:ABC transporter permease subunit [Actinoplanes aureus]MBG0566410.1 ABC transporter permease subunit [Actinoplanes aureus]